MLCQIPRCNDGFEIDIDTQHIWLGWGTGGWEFGEKESRSTIPALAKTKSMCPNWSKVFWKIEEREV
jgi:hypothetical protein